MPRKLFEIAVLAGLTLLAAESWAAEITVNTAADENGTGADCSLREAVAAATADAAFGGCTAGSGNDEINIKIVTPSPATIALTAPLTIASGLSITGPGERALTISAGGADRPIRINGAKVSISGLSLEDGISATGPGSVHVNAGGNLTVEDAVFWENEGFNGGAILNEGTLTVARCTFGRNRSYNNGGAIYSTGTLRLSDSTFEDNADIGFGGGALYIAAPSGTTSISNSTFSSNDATRGKAIQADAGNISFANSTIVNSSFAVYAMPGAGITFRNTVISTVESSCEGAGSFVSQGNNLDTGTSCGFNQSGDLTGADARLGVLAHNGGATKTHLPLAGSPLIDAGDCASSTSADQRGNARPRDADCDIGAVELAACGNGVIGSGEACDDGNTANGDGCSDACRVEQGAAVSCGDGVVQAPELCDDGNAANGDGCGATCQVEPNFSCDASQPSVCSANSPVNPASGGGGGCGLTGAPSGGPLAAMFAFAGLFASILRIRR